MSTIVDSIQISMPDLTVTPANVAPSAGSNPTRGVSAAAILAGDVVALDATGAVVPADANGTAPSDTPVGIAVCSTPGIGQYVMYVATDTDFNPGATTTSGVAYFLSGNPGKICSQADLTAGMKTSLVGFGKTGNKLVVQIVASGQII